MKSLILIAIAMMLSATVKAGDSAHGGGGFLIGKKAYLLDLVEAGHVRNQGGFSDEKLNIVESSDPVDTQIENALKRLDMWLVTSKACCLYTAETSFGQMVREAYNRVKEVRKSIDEGTRLEFPSDADLKLKPANGEKIGLADWQDRVDDQPEVLWYDAEYVDSMTNTNQAALWIHEAVYNVLRTKYRDVDSHRARKIVGYLFSDLKPVKIDRNLMKVSNGLDNVLVMNKKISRLAVFKVRVVQPPPDGKGWYANKCKASWSLGHVEPPINPWQRHKKQWVGTYPEYHWWEERIEDTFQIKITSNEPQGEFALDLDGATEKGLQYRNAYPNYYYLNNYAIAGECDYEMILQNSAAEEVLKMDMNLNYAIELRQDAFNLFVDNKIGIFDVTENPYVLQIPVSLKAAVAK